MEGRIRYWVVGEGRSCNNGEEGRLWSQAQQENKKTIHRYMVWGGVGSRTVKCHHKCSLQNAQSKMVVVGWDRVEL